MVGQEGDLVGIRCDDLTLRIVSMILGRGGGGTYDR